MLLPYGGQTLHFNFNLLFQGGDSEALDYLSKLMLALDSYYHPSNHGKHTVRMYVYVTITYTYVQCMCVYCCMYACIYVRMYVCMYVCMYACMHACMHACMYICTYKCIYHLHVILL